jgi:hypothetical protein
MRRDLDEDGVKTTIKLIGCDFGAPRRAADQAKKIIAIQAVELGRGHYAIRTDGPNARLANWPNIRPGWTVPTLRDWLASDRAVHVAAFDFPFSIPLALLQSREFARRLHLAQAFETRDRWAASVVARLALQFTREGPGGEMAGLAQFDAWRDSSLWQRRACDIATRACPPLKHVGQNLFSMTLAGNALLEALRLAGYQILLDQPAAIEQPVLFETYPSLVARRIGFAGSYKKEPVRCLEKALAFLEQQNIRLDFAPKIQKFCETYRSGGRQSDPDGADAFLCLVAAIAYREGIAEVVYGDASPRQRAEEGGIVAPLGK